MGDGCMEEDRGAEQQERAGAGANSLTQSLTLSLLPPVSSSSLRIGTVENSKISLFTLH